MRNLVLSSDDPANVEGEMLTQQAIEELVEGLGDLPKGADDPLETQKHDLLETQKHPPRRLLPHVTRPFAQCYEPTGLLGSGSFAQVWACTDKRTGQELACKTVMKSSLTYAEKWDNLQREVVVLSALAGKHKGVVRLVDVLEGDKSVHLVMDMCRGGDLYELISRYGRMPEAAARFVIRQVASALCFCHSMGIMHRDIKPENILFDDVSATSLYGMTSADDVPPAVQAKLADFGLSIVLRPGEKVKGTVGSRWYTAPELVQGKKYGRRIDVWSLGVVLCTMLSGKLPFAGRTHSDDDGLRKSILRGKVHFKQPAWDGVSEDAKDVITRMLQVEPSQRITAIDLLRHPWVMAAPQIPRSPQ